MLYITIPRESTVKNQIIAILYYPKCRTIRSVGRQCYFYRDIGFLRIFSGINPPRSSHRYHEHFSAAVYWQHAYREPDLLKSFKKRLFQLIDLIASLIAISIWQTGITYCEKGTRFRCVYLQINRHRTSIVGHVHAGDPLAVISKIIFQELCSTKNQRNK